MTWMYVEKKLELALLVWCRLYVARNLYDISRRYSFPHCPVERLFYLISLINPICGKYFLHGQFNTDLIWCKRSFTWFTWQCGL